MYYSNYVLSIINCLFLIISFKMYAISVKFSRSVVSDFLRPHESQHVYAIYGPGISCVN